MFTIIINQMLVVSNSDNIRVDEHIVLPNTYKSDKELKIDADNILIYLTLNIGLAKQRSFSEGKPNHGG